MDTPPCQEKAVCAAPTQSSQASRRHIIQQGAALCLLAVSTSIVTVVVHTSRRSGLEGQTLYSPAASVLLSELIKLLISSLWEIFQPARLITRSHVRSEQCITNEKGRLLSSISEDPSNLTYKEKTKTLIQQIFCKEAWCMAIPAILYVFQGMVQVMSMSMVSATIYQTLYQLKIATVALFSTWLLGTRIQRHQWLAVLTLTAGVFTITTQRKEPLQLIFDPPSPNPFFRRRSLQLTDAYRISCALDYAEREWRTALGIVYVIVACSLGSLAGVYIEYGLKRRPKTSLSIQNAQLSAFSIITTGLAVLVECISRQSWSTFHGLGTWAWAAIVSRAMVGFVVSFVLKNSGSIAKTFATCFGIVITSLFECIVFQQSLDLKFFTGFLLIIGSTYMYSRPR